MNAKVQKTLILSVIATIVAAFLYLPFFLSETARTSKSVHSVGMLASLDFDFYWDVTATDPVTQIDWGIVYPGSTNVTIYIRNFGNVPLIGSLNTSDWQAWDKLYNGTLVESPENASDYLSVTWNFGSTPLKPGRSRRTTLTLWVDSTIHDIYRFAFTILITGTEVEE